jgi:hypothetical protein
VARPSTGWGALLALVFAGAATAQPLVDDGTGRRTYAPTSVADVRPEYRHGIGELQVDLSGLDIPAGTSVETTVDLGIGSAEVLVPDDVDVLVDGEVGVAVQLAEVGHLEAGHLDTLAGAGLDRAPAGARVTATKRPRPRGAGDGSKREKGSGEPLEGGADAHHRASR